MRLTGRTAGTSQNAAVLIDTRAGRVVMRFANDAMVPPPFLRDHAQWLAMGMKGRPPRVVGDLVWRIARVFGK